MNYNQQHRGIYWREFLPCIRIRKKRLYSIKGLIAFHFPYMYFFKRLHDYSYACTLNGTIKLATLCTLLSTQLKVKTLSALAN